MRDEGTGTSILLETERLFLREMDRNDYDALYRVLADTEIMRHYPYTFDEARVRACVRGSDPGFIDEIGKCLPSLPSPARKWALRRFP